MNKCVNSKTEGGNSDERWQNQRPNRASYLNNLPMALLVCAINVILAFVFQFRRSLTVTDLVVDAALCGVVTAFTSLGYARWAVAARRRRGELPTQVPLSPFMQKLPRSYLPLTILTGVVGSASMVLITLLILRFYPETDYTFPAFLSGRLVTPPGWLPS